MSQNAFHRGQWKKMLWRQVLEKFLLVDLVWRNDFFIPCTSFIFLLRCMNILDQNNKKGIVGVGGGAKCHSDHGRWCLSYTGPLLAGAITLPVV